MESPRLNDVHSKDESIKSSKQATDAIGKNRSASDDIEKKYIPQMSKQKVTSASTLSLSTDDECKTDILGQPSSSSRTSSSHKEKSVSEIFPWLDDVMKANQKCLGSINDLKIRNILSAMDNLIE